MSTTPDPRCAAGDAPSCDGTTVTVCQAGYLTATHDCASGATVGVSDVCQSVSPGEARFAICDGNDSVFCEYGYEVTRTDCGDSVCTAASCVAR